MKIRDSVKVKVGWVVKLVQNLITGLLRVMTYSNCPKHYLKIPFPLWFFLLQSRLHLIVIPNMTRRPHCKLSQVSSGSDRALAPCKVRNQIPRQACWDVPGKSESLELLPIVICICLIFFSQNRCARGHTTGCQHFPPKKHSYVWLYHDNSINNSAAFGAQVRTTCI